MKFICLWLLCWAGSLVAQPAFEIYDTGNSGLPFDWVNDIAVDASGLIWFGTEFGLASYDGSVWSTYSMADSDLPDDVIRSLEIGPDGHTLWVGTFLGGLAKFDGTTWTVWNSTNSDLPENFIRDIEIDASGTLWIGTTGGLAVFDGVATWTIWNTVNSNLPGNNIPCIHITPGDTIWVGSINAGVSRFEGKGFVTWNIANSDLIDNTILDLESDSKGNLWMAHPAGGLGLMSPDEDFLNFLSVNSDIPDSEVFRLTIDSEDNIWLGLASAGLVRFDGEEWQVWDMSNSNIPGEIIRGLFLNSDTSVWVGTEEGGAARLNPSDTVVVSGLSSANTTSVSVYPNPLSTFIRIASPSFENQMLNLQLYNLAGRVILSAKFPGGNPVQVDLPKKLSSGVLFIHISGEALDFRTKLVVE